MSDSKVKDDAIADVMRVTEWGRNPMGKVFPFNASQRCAENLARALPEIDRLRAELEAAKQDAAKCAAAHINAVSACNENAHLLTKASAELAELRARAGELERQVRDKHEAATVDEICNAYESGVGHRGRPTASVNPYRQGSDLATAYNIGALGDRESPAAAAVPDDVAKDAERLDWLVSEVALVQSLAISPPHGDGTTRYYIVWPEYGEEQRDTYATPREAIDAAILAAKENKP